MAYVCLAVAWAPALAAQSSRQLEIVVSNQQSESASLINADGSVKHVTVGTGPHEAAISRDGRIAVATIYGTQVPGNQLAVIDLAKDSVIRTINLGDYTRPHGAVFISDAPLRVAVTSESTQSVVIVNVDAGVVESVISTDARGSHMIAVTADAKRGFTANVADNSVSEIDLAGRNFVRHVSVPPRPEGIAVTPDGSEVWVGSNQTGAVSVINTASGEITHTLSGVRFPYRLGASSDGKLMAIVDGMGGKIHIASVPEHRIIAAVDVVEPRGVQFGPDNSKLYVTLGGGSLVVIDVAKASVIQTIPVQASPDGVAVRLR